MSNQTPDITLTISSDIPAPSGYTPTGTLNYSYKFTGGNDGAGGITGKDNDGAISVNFTLAATATMSISSVSFFTVDANGNKTPYSGPELDWNPDNQEPVTSGKIKDKMDNVQDYYYSVSVSVPLVGDFTCDPPIKNET